MNHAVSTRQGVFESEHASLNQILMNIMLCQDLPQVIGCLDALEPLLIAHIGSEEAPDGFVSLLTRMSVVPAAVKRITEDHRQFVRSAADLRHEARSMLTDDLCADHLPSELSDMRSRVIHFSDAVLNHERYESKIYLAALDLQACGYKSPEKGQRL